MMYTGQHRGVVSTLTCVFCQEYELDVNGQETVWTEMIRGKDMAGKGLSVKSGAGVTDPELADQAKLGRIKSGWFDGAW